MTTRLDDGIVVALRHKGRAMPFFKTLDKILVAIDYKKTAEGSWRAEFHGFADVSVEAKTLEECRREILDEIDLKLAKLVIPQRADTDFNHA